MPLEKGRKESQAIAIAESESRKNSPNPNQILAPGSLYSMKPPVVDKRSMAQSFYGKKA